MAAALSELVNQMRIKESKCMDDVFERIENEETLTGKCILCRNYLNPQSGGSAFERFIKKDLEIGPAINEISGDGHKKQNGNNYEIKVSLWSKNSEINYLQIRPHHNIDYYIFVAYNLYEDGPTGIGNAHIFKVPANDVYGLIIKYGTSCAHGTISENGIPNIDNIRNTKCEYALRANSTAKKGKKLECWNDLMKYEVEYTPDNF